MARSDPTNPYGATKLVLENALPWYEAAYGLRYASLRYFNAAGATDRCGEWHDQILRTLMARPSWFWKTPSPGMKPLMACATPLCATSTPPARLTAAANGTIRSYEPLWRDQAGFGKRPPLV